MEEGVDRPSFELGVDNLPAPALDLVPTTSKRAFRPLDLDRLAAIDKLNLPKSTLKKNHWAMSKFDDWRRVTGKPDLQIPIQELDLRKFAEYLAEFLQQVLKDDGTPFPASSIRDLFLSFGRVLREARIKRIQDTGMDEPEFDIMKHPFFQRARNAALAVIREVSETTARKPKQVDRIITNDEMEVLLARPELDPSNGNGLFRRVVLFCIHFFLIRSLSELYELKYGDFHFLEDVYGRYVQFLQRSSKNHKASLQQAGRDQRRFVEVYENVNPRVYTTFLEFYKRQPPREVDEDISNRPLFLAVIVKPNSDIWYCKRNRIGEKKFAAIGSLITEVTGIKLTNKSLRHSSITTLSLCNVPDDVATKFTGHKRTDNLHQYDHAQKLQMMAIQSLLAKTRDDSGQLREYNKVLKDLEEKTANQLTGHKRKTMEPENDSNSGRPELQSENRHLEPEQQSENEQQSEKNQPKSITMNVAERATAALGGPVNLPSSSSHAWVNCQGCVVFNVKSSVEAIEILRNMR